MWDVTIFSSSTLASSRFLLTHPVWDVTTGDVAGISIGRFLLTHPVWDVTYFSPSIQQIISDFYSHIPCGMWHVFFASFLISSKFLLTHPVWDVTPVCSITSSKVGISTHTSRVGCDPLPHSTHVPPNNFYSHIPCGMWRNIHTKFKTIMKFLLTHPVWDVTVEVVRNYKNV